MRQWKPGDRFTVTDAKAPFFTYTGRVLEIDEGDPYPVVATVASDGRDFPVSYKAGEIELLVQDDDTESIPVVTA